jgi:hypothetical protein
MRDKRTPLTALALAIALALPPRAGLAGETPKTVSDYATAMNAAATQLDVEVSDRQKTGDMGAAQRLVLAAAMVRRTAEEFRSAEQDALTDPVSGLPAPVPERAEAALAKAAEAETRAADHADFADEAHVVFNALLAILPQKTPHPVLFGMLSGDLAEPAGQLGHDVVIYGYRLIDPIYKIEPVVLYGKSELDAANVAVKDDRIDVTLPEAVKKSVHFAPPPCDSRPSFGLRVRSVYGETFGRWPVLWHSQAQNNIDFYALPTPVVYSAAIAADAETTSTQATNVTFRQRGVPTVADCERIASADIVLPLPDNARDVVCSAAWVDTSSAAKLTGRCTVEGHNVHAVGEISGGPKVCSPDKLCTCSAEAQGVLEASGSYRVVEAASQMQVAADWPPLSFPAGGVTHGRIDLGDGRRLRLVALALTRRACPTPVDSIDLPVGEDPNAKVTGVSKTGAFRASIQGGALTVGAADAVAASGESTP